MSGPEPLHPSHLTSKTDAELAAMQEHLQAAEDRYLRLSQWHGEMVIQVMRERSQRWEPSASSNSPLTEPGSPQAPKGDS